MRNSLTLSFGIPFSEDSVRKSQEVEEDDGKLESRFTLSKPLIKSKNPRLGPVNKPIVVSRYLTEQIDDCASARESKGPLRIQTRARYINQSYCDSEVKPYTKSQVQDLIENNKKLLQMRARLKDPSLSRTLQAKYAQQVSETHSIQCVSMPISPRV